MLHLPVLRGAESYRSIETRTLLDVATGVPVAEVSQANRGLVSRDMPKLRAAQSALEAFSMPELLAMLRKAADLFMDGEVLVDPIDGVMQTPEQYVRMQSATTGMPQALCRRNMEKIRFVMAEMSTVLDGLTRGLDLGVLDRGWGHRAGGVISYIREADLFGAVLPSNSPGVHSLWIPAIALKVPLLLKPGSQEPWTPVRILQSMAAAGIPREALGFYPTDHGGASDILLKTDRSMVFGDAKTVEPWRLDTRVQLHGPGWSKLLLGEDRADDYAEWLELMATSIAENGGRACLNASGVWTPRNGRALGVALAERLAKIEPLALDDPNAAIAAFAQPEIAHK
ncbi:aldehyde dehydrogenase, partial [bacterium]|nr:aldehyde dehydrogenase [bacterium]